MFRYVAFYWNVASATARETVHALARRLTATSTNTLEWKLALGLPGLEVYIAGTRDSTFGAYPLHANQGVVLGTLYERGANVNGVCSQASFTQGNSETIVKSAGRSLVDDYWGRYVAVISERGSRRVSILRDPTGSLPCYHMEFQGVRVIFSKLDTCSALQLPNRGVNWSYIERYVVCEMHHTDETGLVGVAQLRAGECMDIEEGTVTHRFYWSPLDVAASDPIESDDAAVRAVRDMTRRCVQTWVSGHSAAVLRLSGGLDSSIMAVCLKSAPTRPRVVGLNYFSAGSDTDERAYARTVADHVGMELVERPRNSQLRLDGIFDIAPEPEPTVYVGYLEYCEPDVKLATEKEATAIYSGGGGDQLFYQARAMFAAGDYISLHGLRSPAIRVLLAAARLERTSVWTVLQHALAHGLGGRRWHVKDDQGRFRSFASPDVVDRVRNDVAIVHPWFRNTTRTPSGKIWHSFSLSFSSTFYNPCGGPDDPEKFCPFLSQPLIELLLRIPTYLLIHGGWDRAIARRAFADELPPEIAWRRTKGGMEEHARALLLLNLPFIRDVLLGGQLVTRRLVDGKKLEEFLSLGPSQVTGGMPEIFSYVCLEAWLQRVSTEATALAA